MNINKKSFTHWIWIDNSSKYKGDSHVMDTKIIYETDTMIFQCPLTPVIEHLKYLINQHNVLEAREILSFIESSTTDLVKISERYQYIKFVVLNLLEKNQGVIVCRECKKTFKPDELIFSHRSNLMPMEDRQRGWIKRIKEIFEKKKRRLPGMFGATRIECPCKNEIMYIIRWIS